MKYTAHNKDAFMHYTYQELGQFIGLLVKRANMRVDPKKKDKDLMDAINYCDMMRAKLETDIENACRK